MIRINLLPFRAARKKENIRRQVSIFSLMLVLVILCLVYYVTWVDRKIDHLNSGITQLKGQIALYKDKADQVTSIKKKLKILEQKLDIVHSLEAKRKAPVQLVEAIILTIGLLKIWSSATHFHLRGKIAAMAIIYIGIIKILMDFFKQGYHERKLWSVFVFLPRSFQRCLPRRLTDLRCSLHMVSAAMLCTTCHLTVYLNIILEYK